MQRKAHRQCHAERSEASLFSQLICNDNAREQNANLFACFTATAAYLRILRCKNTLFFLNKEYTRKKIRISKVQIYKLVYS